MKSSPGNALCDKRSQSSWMGSAHSHEEDDDSGGLARRVWIAQGRDVFDEALAGSEVASAAA